MIVETSFVQRPSAAAERVTTISNFLPLISNYLPRLTPNSPF
ncbi:MAG: hypothetical protein JWO80_4509 [Bryobacterales bacterium]|nr:hypothetical protein [Bryobacterales bacterium]